MDKNSNDAQNKDKILYVINHIDWFWSHRLPLANGAKQSGLDVHLAVTGASNDEKLKNHGFTGHELPDSQKGFMPFTLLKTIHSTSKLIKQQQPKYIHAITLKYAFIAGLAALPYKNVRVIHTIAGLGYLFSGEGLKPKILRTAIMPLLKLALKNSKTHLIFQNPDDMALMHKRGLSDENRAHLIKGSGVDTSAFKNTPIPETENPIILMPTRLVHNKGIAIFIEAAKIAATQKPHLKFQIAGGITHNNPLAITESQMKDMLSDSPVEWLGKVSDMPALLEKTSLICYPSYYGEGVPKVLLEACACARAIITTDHPGCREAVADGQNGLLVPVKNAQKTAQAILSIIDNKETLNAMSKAGRNRAETEFDAAIIVQKTLEVYSK